MQIPFETSETSRVHDVLAVIGDAVAGLFWMSAADGSPLYQNRAWREYAGTDAGIFGAVGWDVLVHPSDLPLLLDVWRQAHREARAFEGEYRCRRHDGAYRWFLCRSSPLLDDSGQVTHWVGTLTDIHAQKVAESELTRSIRRRDELLAALAHELRNPLQAMRQAIDILQTPGASPDVVGQMRVVIDAQFKQLTRLTDDLLDGNRVRWNALSLVPQETTLQRLVDAAVASAKPTIEEHRHQLKVRVMHPDCAMTVDTVRVTQALVNLMTNAAKYTDRAGRIELTASCDDGRARFVVQDWGRGIDADTLPRIFDLFERGECERNASSEGFGIGLALVRHVAELHGGQVKAHSRGPGRGSRFTLRIPLVAPPLVDAKV